MLSLAPDFWPLFWAIVGGGALVTVVLALLVAAFPRVWFRSPDRRRPTLTPPGPARRHAGSGHRAAKAA